MDTNELTNLSDEFMRFESGNNFGMMSTDLYTSGDVYMDEGNEDDADVEADDIIILHMDIREPLSQLQKILELKIGIELSGYTFWLQDAQELEPHKNLVDQCVKGEGLVQINCQIQTITQRINIVDVLKPTEAALAALGVEGSGENDESNEGSELFYELPESQADEEMEEVCEEQIEHVIEEKTVENDPVQQNQENLNQVIIEDIDDDDDDVPCTSSKSKQAVQKPCLNWVFDSKFRKEQNRLNIPEDPMEWSQSQVKFWFDWAVKEFKLTNVNYADWMISGSELCSLTHEQFHKKLPNDPGNTFWTHIQLLRECKFVSVVHRKIEKQTEPSEQVEVITEEDLLPKEPKIMRTKLPLGSGTPEGSPLHVATVNNYNMSPGNNGQVQLWQFLLELLTDREHTNIIQWVGTEGEFKLVDPECVARLWGEKKNKPAMNYEKLSRALRYYYDGDMISKVSGKRFAYKFDCDLQFLIGYSAAELAALVNEAPEEIETENDLKKLSPQISGADDELSPPSEED